MSKYIYGPTFPFYPIFHDDQSFLCFNGRDGHSYAFTYEINKSVLFSEKIHWLALSGSYKPRFANFAAEKSSLGQLLWVQHVLMENRTYGTSSTRLLKDEMVWQDA